MRTESNSLRAICQMARREQRDRGAREMVFLCGDAEGFPEALRAPRNASISLSPLTMPHEFARVVLAEQIYRAFAILAGTLTRNSTARVYFTRSRTSFIRRNELANRHELRPPSLARQQSRRQWEAPVRQVDPMLLPKDSTICSTKPGILAQVLAMEPIELTQLTAQFCNENAVTSAGTVAGVRERGSARASDVRLQGNHAACRRRCTTNLQRSPD